MKIAIVINELNIRGGTHKQVLRLCQYLKKNDYQFTIFTKYYDINRTYPEFNEMDIVYLQNEQSTFQVSKHNLLKKIGNRIKKYSEDIRLLKKIDKDFDIINVHDNGVAYLMFFACMFRKSKIVWQINDMPSCFRIGNAKEEAERIPFVFERWLYKRLAKRVDKITVNVTKNKHRVKEFFGVNSSVLYCGVDENGKLVKHSFRYDAETYHLLSAGVLFPYRNYETLVNVTKVLREEGRNIHLDIIGSKDADIIYSQKLMEYIKDKNMDEYVTLWGQVDEQTYNTLYNQADFFAFVNIDQSWGLAVFEAMSCGLPVIVSDSVGAIELLHNEVDSIILDPKDVNAICENIRSLMDNKAFYDTISQMAIDNTKTFTWDRLYSSGLVEIFKGLEGEK